MIKANELRIGNWVYQSEFEAIHGIGKKAVQFSESNWYRIVECIEYLEDFEPIPLKGSEVERLGFTKENETIYSKTINGIKYLYYEGTLGQVRTDIKGYNVLYLCEPKYVHGFQNVIFALTGEELVRKQ